MKKFTIIILTYTHSILSLMLAACCIGWIVLIGEGTYANGHLPTYGDIETISFDGWDRVFVWHSLTIMFLGGLLWLILTLINKKFKFIKLNKTVFTIGLISFILSILIIFSPFPVWALD